MPFDKQLAMRARNILHEHAEILERRMFGGIAFKVHNEMFGGIVGEDLIVRLGTQVTLDNPYLRAMEALPPTIDCGAGSIKRCCSLQHCRRMNGTARSMKMYGAVNGTLR